MAATRLPSGATRGAVKSKPGADKQGPALAGARVDNHEVLAQPAAAIVDGPSGDGQAPVRGQLEGVLVQGAARLGVRSRGARPRSAATRPAPGASGHVGDQQPLLVRPEIMIPVPDQGCFVQDGRHAGVGAGPALPPVRSGPAGAGQDRRGERGLPRAGGGGQPAECRPGARRPGGPPRPRRGAATGPAPARAPPRVRGGLRAWRRGAGRAGTGRPSRRPAGRQGCPPPRRTRSAGPAGGPAGPVSTRQMLDLTSARRGRGPTRSRPASCRPGPAAGR